MRLDIAVPDDLRGRAPYELFERLCELDGRSHDPCLLDTFVAAVSYAEGGPARPWWEFSRERKGASAAVNALGCPGFVGPGLTGNRWPATVSRANQEVRHGRDRRQG